MTSSEGYTADRIALRRRVLNLSRPHMRHLVLAATIACILALAALKAGAPATSSRLTCSAAPWPSRSSP